MPDPRDKRDQADAWRIGERLRSSRDNADNRRGFRGCHLHHFAGYRIPDNVYRLRYPVQIVRDYSRVYIGVTL